MQSMFVKNSLINSSFKKTLLDFVRRVHCFYFYTVNFSFITSTQFELCLFLIISRITNLEKDLKKARKKEAEDTKVLEDAVKMVEENLRKTTVRKK